MSDDIPDYNHKLEVTIQKAKVQTASNILRDIISIVDAGKALRAGIPIIKKSENSVDIASFVTMVSSIGANFISYLSLRRSANYDSPSDVKTNIRDLEATIDSHLATLVETTIRMKNKDSQSDVSFEVISDGKMTRISFDSTKSKYLEKHDLSDAVYNVAAREPRKKQISDVPVIPSVIEQPILSQEKLSLIASVIHRNNIKQLDGFLSEKMKKGLLELSDREADELLRRLVNQPNSQ